MIHFIESYRQAEFCHFSFLTENIANAIENTSPATATSGMPFDSFGMKSVVQRMQEPTNSTQATSVSTEYLIMWLTLARGSSQPVSSMFIFNSCP